MKKKTDFDLEVARVLSTLRDIDPDSDGYRTAAENLKVLCEARSIKVQHISPEAILSAVTNIIGICIIVSHERLYNITSKALNFIKK